MRGWWWTRKETTEGAEKKEISKKILHFSPMPRGTSLCGLTPNDATDKGLDEESVPGGVRPASKGAEVCKVCVDKVVSL